KPSLFDTVRVESTCTTVTADIRDPERLRQVVAELRPDFVFHLAAQALVRRSYRAPLVTLETNVLGTAHVLEAIRLERVACTAVVVTSDKCYELSDPLRPRVEDDRLGGSDVYSMSKSAAELVVASYRRSFFSTPERDTGRVM